jgi:hypothetical protein
MTDITQPNIGVPQSRDLGGPIPVQSSTAQGISDISQGINAAVGALQQYRAAKVGGQLGAIQDDLLSQTSAYQQRVNQITSEMTAADPVAYTKLDAELTRLRNGEEQGKLSASGALLLFHKAAKDFSVRYPTLASNIRQYTASFTGELGQMLQTEQSDKDIVLRAREELLSQSVKEGKTPQRLLMDKEIRDKASDAVAFAAAAAANGKMNQEDVESGFRTVGSVFKTDTNSPIGAAIEGARQSAVSFVYSDIINKYQKGEVPKEQTILALTQLKLHLADSWRNYIHKLSTDSAAAPGGTPLIFDNQDDMLKHISEPVDTLLTMVEKTDPAAMRQRLADIDVQVSKDKDYMKIHAMLGSLAPMIMSGQDPISSMGKILDVFRDASKGLKGDYEALGNYSGTARMYLDMMDDPQGFLKTYAKDFAAKLDGSDLNSR